MNILIEKAILGALVGVSVTAPLSNAEINNAVNPRIIEGDIVSENSTLTKINKVITNSLYFINKKTENHFVYESYKGINIDLEKDLKEMKLKNGTEIKKEHLRRGDLVFYEVNNVLDVGLFNGSDGVIIIKNKEIILEKVDNLKNINCKRILSQNKDEEELIQKEKEKEEAKKKLEEENRKKKEQAKANLNDTSNNTSNNTSSNTSNNGTPYFGSNGLLAMKNSPNARKVINLLLGIPGHRNGKAYHQRTGLDDVINSLSVEEATYVIRMIEGSGFGQTSDGFAGIDSHISHKAFLNRQVNRRFGGSIHALLRAWGTYSYGGY